MDWTIIVTALITALLGGGGVAAFLNSKNTRRQIDVDSWCKLIDQQSKRIDVLSERVTSLEAQVVARDTRINTLTDRVNLLEARVVARDVRIDELEQEIDELREWIMKQGLTPPPRHRKRNPVR